MTYPTVDPVSVDRPPTADRRPLMLHSLVLLYNAQ